MSPDEYGLLCDRILTETMKYIKTDDMRRYHIGKSNIENQDPIYASAVISGSPITLVYTPAGSGKSKLITDRAHTIIQNGTPASSVAILSMNIAKAKQTKNDIPGITSMTFSDFTHTIFTANYNGYELSDITSIINTLKLHDLEPFGKALLDKLSMTNPQDRASLFTVFVNNHLDDIEKGFKSISKIDYSVESMICQNRIYQLEKNPFSFDEIIINGVHNMPLPTLCCVLEYAFMYNCNLFITGMPDETIYEFSMAYSGAMNILSSYATEKNISIIRLPATRMNDDIQNTLLCNETASINAANVHMTNVIAKCVKDPTEILTEILAPGIGYIDQKLTKKEHLLIIAQSKTDITFLKKIIQNYYGPKYPNISMLDLTEIQPPTSMWGTVLSKCYKSIMIDFPTGINKVELYGQLWTILSSEIEHAASDHMKELYQESQNKLKELASSNWRPDDYIKKPVITMIQSMIDEESRNIQAYNLHIKQDVDINIQNVNIVFSTIHSATDICSDNVIIYFRNFTNKINENVYRVALSRANKSEYLIFMNSDNFDVPVQQYLKHHLSYNSHRI